MVAAAPNYVLKELLEDAAETGELALLEQDLEHVTLGDLLRDDQVRDILQWWPVGRLLAVAGGKNGLSSRVKVIVEKTAIPVGRSLPIQPGSSVYNNHVQCVNCKLLFKRGQAYCPKCGQRLRTKSRTKSRI